MIVGVPRESHPGEQRVALVPSAIAPLARAGLEVAVESAAGEGAGYPDAAYAAQGATIAGSRDELFARADLVLQVRGTNFETGRADVALLRPGQVLVGLFDVLASPSAVQELAARGVTLFALELMPRITRAQAMDVLSSMSVVAGYKAVLLAAGALSKMFPMMMTAAGTLAPAKVLVVGAGVAGLQAISTARRLGAVVRAYDVRQAVKEEVESLGAKFVEMQLETTGSEDEAGYAKALGEAFYRRQRELMTQVVAESDVVITTAAVPGKRAPVLITAEMARAMAPGSVIVDLAAERGGNCELTRAGETVVESGVKILGPVNLAATLPQHASQMYSKNVATFLAHLVKDGKLEIDTADEITRETLVARDGQMVHPRVLEALGGSRAAAGHGSRAEG
jgi:NAD(P) transhydrogenase subunit alpha